MRIILLCLVAACSGSEPDSPNPSTVQVRDVAVSGDAYTFAVTLRSPDTGCEQYADWWEVVGADGTLIYRRILGHSHVDEQPFSRTGGPIDVSDDDEIIVRAHMHPSGYGEAAMQGTVASGFTEVQLAPDFAASIETIAPQPDGCAF